MSAPGLGRVKTPTFNLRVEIPSRFRKFENQKCLRPPLREDDRENNSAHSWLVHVFTQPGSLAEAATSLRHVRSTPRKQTQFGHRLRSGPCRFCCKSRHTDGAGRLMPFVEAVRCHPLDCAGRLTLDFTDACNVTQSTQGRVVVAGRPTWQACEGSAQSLPT